MTFLKAIALGLGLGTLLYLIEFVSPWWISVAVCTILAVVLWCGFHLTHAWHTPRRGRPPEREAMRAMALISLIYVGLLLIAVGLVRLFLDINLWANPGMAAFSFLIGFAISNFMVAKASLVHLLEAEGAKAKAEARAGLLALQAQLQPHTLFNALNTIAALIPEDPAKAEAATEALSRLLRRIMTALEKEQWTLAEEFSVLEDLLSLERLRFGDRLRVHLNLDPAESTREVPPLLLLPLVENTLKHGFQPKVGICTLWVEAREGRILVRDDGVGGDLENPAGLGLRTVRERLEAQEGRIEWSVGSEGCTVEVTL